MREENKLIAEFMGFKIQDNPNERFYNQYFTEPNGTWGSRIEIMHFDSSWDWLMPVVEKIRKINCYDRGDIFNVQFIISNDRIEFHQGGYTKKESYWYQNNGIESVYKAVIGCITMYNNELKP
jgi:hypothetical protein